MAATTPDMDSSHAIWRKSTYSNGGEGACVEVVALDEGSDDQ